ncbi:hypothetical protein Cantr_00091 [Candida viswanathii]|jgi:ubiquinone/menaquinone biosynthesis C-methylase UbiE|uniref:Methyltransferase domain-containing protein n=1 Tax=Candida viswanathii TaxID=5486 RepID=A0A367YGY9_9ASCO|nr:hypothetical protein Cantr_00091 [Candida viswanathii]
MSNHKEAIDANLAIFNKEFAVKYDGKESQQTLALLFAKFILEYDFAHPMTRKTPQETEKSIGDPTKPFNGFTKENALPDPKTYLQDFPDSIFKPGTKVLDFACGTGMVTEYFAPYVKGGELVGMDISSVWLERFNERAKKFDDPVMKSYVYDVLDETKQEELKQFEGQFDAVICTIAYHHIHNYEQVTKKLATFLRPGGWLFIVDFYNEDVEKQGVAVSKAVQHMGGLKIDSLNNTLGNIAGLVNVSSAREFKTWVWQPELFISTHLNQETIDKLNNGELPKRTAPDGDVEYLIESSLIYAVGQRK